MVLGWLLPPLAVAVRFGIGKDFFINVICTICGYIPGHGHNFFIQNIRNNKHSNRTPKWATRYGLVEDYDKKRQKKRAWTGRYKDQNGERRMYDDEGNAYTYDRDHQFEDGDGPSRQRQPKSNSVNGLEERYYGENGSVPSGMSSDRRSSSSRSINGDAYGGGYSGDEPGAGEAERRRAKKQSQFRGLLGSKKGKADRHARSEQVMGVGDDLHSNPYDTSFDGMNDQRNGYNRRDSYDDARPEDPDSNVGKRYASTKGSNGRHQDPLSGKVLPSAPSHQAPTVDIMDQRHDF